MKRYKLIKEYPGSPVLGTIVSEADMTVPRRHGFGNIPSVHVIDQPEFWELMDDKKNWKILKFEDNFGSAIRGEDDRFRHPAHPGSVGMEEESLIKQGATIHSIIRLSDGEVFTINDKVEGYKNTGIKYFRVYSYGLRAITDANGEGCVASELSWKIENLRKIKEPLFITKDGVKMYEGNTCYFVRDFTVRTWPFMTQMNYNSEVRTGRIHTDIHFSTKEKAEEYIAMNRPQYSLNEVLEATKALGGPLFRCARMTEYLRKLKK